MAKPQSNLDMEFNTVQREVLHSNGSEEKSDSKPEFKAAVGLSREWDARKAGREVARDALEKLGRDPDFFLLFSTIHYEKWGGFQEFLDGVWDVLPKGTPLIGGTVAGFINPQGCFTRGATAMAVSYPNMDVAMGVGRNTKRSPHFAVRECATTIRNALKNSKHTTKFLFKMTSGVMLPQFPIIGFMPVIKSKIIGKLVIKFSDIMYLLQRGIGREEEILEELVKYLPEYYISGGSTYDDNRMITNYQFFKNHVLTNALVGLGASFNFNVSINTSHGLTETGVKFRVTKFDNKDRTISEINGKPAVGEMFRLLGLYEDMLNERIHRITYYMPLGFKKNNILFPEVMGFFMGDSIMCGYKIENPELCVLSASGKSLLKSIDENLNRFEGRDILMGFGTSCSVRMETLGHGAFSIWEKFKNFFNGKPFLLVYGAGEDVYNPNNKSYYHINEGLDMSVFWK